jgi:2,5-diketo-D-gluconate reductase A
MRAPTTALNDGGAIPQIGLGTWPLNDAEAAATVATAIAAGYRHIDTAARYGNERGVGKGIRDSGIRREEIFVTTKLDGAYQGDDRAIGGLDESLRRLDLEYVDLLLIHWPLPQRDLFISTWKTFERLVADGRVRSIGVSNFKPAHLDRLLAEATIPPAVNQIQLSPYITRDDQRAYNASHGIVTVAWGPLAPGSDLLRSPVVADLAAAHGRTPGQIVLRWHIELGNVAIPKSASPERLAQNLAVFDFALSAAEVAAISALGVGGQGVDSDTSGH